MSSKQRTKTVAKKRVNKSQTSANKRQKVSHAGFDNGIIPLTATTSRVLLMKSNLSDQALQNQMSMVSPPPVISKNVRLLNSRILSDMEKYSPEHVKLSCAARRIPNSSHIINVSKMSKYSPKNIKSPCSSSVSPNIHLSKRSRYVGKRGKILQSDVAARQKKSSEFIIPATKPITKRIECNKFEEDESMLLFFNNLLPYTTGLTEEKKIEFKSVVVQWFKTAVSTSLESLLD